VLVVTLDFLQQRTLDFEVLDHGFNDPVHLGQAFEVICKVADRDQASQRRLEKGCRLGFAGSFESRRGNLVTGGPVGVGRNDVEQVGGDAGIGHMRCDAGAHRSSAQDCDLMDPFHVTPRHFLTVNYGCTPIGVRPQEPCMTWERECRFLCSEKEYTSGTGFVPDKSAAQFRKDQGNLSMAQSFFPVRTTTISE